MKTLNTIKLKIDVMALTRRLHWILRYIKSIINNIHILNVCGCYVGSKSVLHQKILLYRLVHILSNNQLNNRVCGLCCFNDANFPFSII